MHWSQYQNWNIIPLHALITQYPIEVSFENETIEYKNKSAKWHCGRHTTIKKT